MTLRKYAQPQTVQEFLQEDIFMRTVVPLETPGLKHTDNEFQ